MKVHLRNTLEKLRVRACAQAAAFAIQAGLVSLEQLVSADTTACSGQPAGSRQFPVEKHGAGPPPYYCSSPSVVRTDV